MISFDQIQKLEHEHGSPFYLFDENAFIKNYDDIVAAFRSRYDKFLLAYSYKTNYIPYLCSIIKNKGGWAEVVSRLEYDLALKTGQSPEKIIFNGPVKQYEDIALALDNQSTVNLDSAYEIEYVVRYAKSNTSKSIKIGLRINIGLSDAAGTSHIQDSLKVGRFGFSPAKADITRTISRLAACENVKINSLHGHTSTTDRSLWCYEIITQTLCDIAAEYLPDTIEYINIGGGIYGHIPEQMRWKQTPSFDEYAATVTDVLKNSPWAQKQKPTLVLEPGVAMVADTLSFITKVVSVKTIHDELFVTVDGSGFHTKPTFHKVNQPFEIIKSANTNETATYNVVGSTCMEKDYLLTNVTAARPEPGDYIKIDSAGAYTVVLSPPFINPAPAILVKNDQGCKAIRTRQTLDDMFSNYSFED